MRLAAAEAVDSGRTTGGLAITAITTEVLVEVVTTAAEAGTMMATLHLDTTVLGALEDSLGVEEV